MADDRYAFIDDLSNDELRSRLIQRGVSPFIVDNLVSERDTSGARWRIAQELEAD